MNATPGEVLEEIVQLIEGAFADYEQDDDCKRIIARGILRHLEHYRAKSVEPPRSKPPMSDAEAKAFGIMRMDFGKHAGKRIDEIELSYLEWLADQPFQRELGRYLQSRRIKQENE